MDNQQNLLYSAWRSAQYYVPDWMGGESGGEWIHVYVWLSPFAVHLKLPPKKKKKKISYTSLQNVFGVTKTVRPFFLLGSVL